MLWFSFSIVSIPTFHPFAGAGPTCLFVLVPSMTGEITYIYIYIPLWFTSLSLPPCFWFCASESALMNLRLWTCSVLITLMNLPPFVYASDSSPVAYASEAAPPLFFLPCPPASRLPPPQAARYALTIGFLSLLPFSITCLQRKLSQCQL